MRRSLVPVLLSVVMVPATASAAPNVVVIETDDQTVADMAAMPRTRALIGAEGTTFANSFVSLSECCPSRATFLTGQYAHNHGVLSIAPPLGGFGRLHGSETLPVWLQRAGYSTALIGKYLNGYGGTRVPPGWTDFEGLLSRFTYRFYDYRMNVNGHIEHHGYGWREYQTDLITRRALRFIDGQSRPFFLWATYVAPHIGRPHDFDDPLRLNSTVPAARDSEAFLGTPLPRPPSFDEADVSDKPPGIRNRPRLRPGQIWALEQTHRQRLASLVAVDEGVARIVGALRAAGKLDDTLLVFTSDNGFLLGEHRVLTGKILPYEPSIRVPLMMRGPGVPRGARRRDLVWNGDLAPTILDAAGARSAFPLDGRSLLRRPRPGRDILLEGPPANRTNGMPRFIGLRTPRYKWVEYITGARELYDLRRDPDETRNLAHVPSTARLRASLRQRLARLAGCAGAACR